MEFFDQIGARVSVPASPQRIVSLVPSQTELLYDLGLDAAVAGITKFCVHPEKWHRTKTQVGGTKKFNFDTIDQLRPDLIIGNKEENYFEGIELLKKKYPVWVSDISDLTSAIEMVRSIGSITDKEKNAEAIVKQIAIAFSNLKIHHPQKVLYLIWKKPWMAAGRDTFISAMIEAMGLKNCINESRYPEITEEGIRNASPDLIFLSSEPYPFREESIDELKQIAPAAKIMLVDGEYFSWYGTRMIQSPRYFNRLSI